MSVRDELQARIEAAIPADWRVIPSQRSFDSIDGPTIILKQLKLANTQGAHRGSYTYTYVLTLIVPGEDMERVEADLDEHVEGLWQILDGLSNISPQDAEKVSVKDLYLGYDITTEILAQKVSS